MVLFSLYDSTQDEVTITSFAYLKRFLNDVQTHTSDTRKPAFRWLGCRGKPDNVSVPNDSRKRIFGSDVTNISFKRNKIDSLFDGNSKGDLKLQEQRKYDNLGDEVDRRNLEHELRQSSKSYQFGPFAPTGVAKVGVPESNSAKRVHDWESLASTYSPRYQNEGIISCSFLVSGKRISLVLRIFVIDSLHQRFHE